jgi:hypothetical protein
VNDYADQQLALLRPLYPQWCLWVVRNVVSRHVTWHAKPHGAPSATVHADSPEELIAKISEQDEQ